MVERNSAGGKLAERLMSKQIFVSIRGQSVRVAPHLYNTDEDIERLFKALGSA